MINDIFYKTLVMHITEGLLAGQTQDHRYINRPGQTKEQHLCEDAFNYAEEIMNRFNKLDEKENLK